MKETIEEVEELKKEVKEIEQEGFALEFIKDYKKQNKRLFIIWIITFIAFICLLGYTIYLLNDIGVEETTTETETYSQNIDDTGDINNSNINNGGVINGKD